ncbi:DNA-binding response OmpR family regulator [Pseudomonas duriflava]|uniref:DNA-binding response OmpR family regulator n=1 Tax=Pseudomonas duriflava TaxID=459528 RepID=A0A562QE20_9PSED|nr:response regulator transcription factor [Pseudomonas duriflava]TWI54998.1 DNA-binding response OmpR family regulator [Pseudomonas duriflava]
MDHHASASSLPSDSQSRWAAEVLLVDDDAPMRQLIIDYLARFSLRGEGAANGTEMRQALARTRFDIIILDLMLPGEDGLTLCRWLRKEGTTPILMLTAQSEPTDRIIGLELGADDYMAKPFEPRELVARIQSVLRRTQDNQGVRRGATRTHIRFDGWKLDGIRHQLESPSGMIVPLSNAEVRMLWVFIEHPRQVLSREQLLDATRGRSIEAFDRSIDLQVSRLRQKLGDDPRAPRLIKTVRGEGYLFDAQKIGN